MTHDISTLEQAAIWAVRTSEPDFADWDGFIAWLEQDPANSAAYDQVKASVDEAAAMLGDAAAKLNDNTPVRRGVNRGWFTAVAGIAAAVTAVFGAWLLNDPTYSIETEPGGTRLVALDGGGEVLLSGGTKMTFDKNNPDLVVLDRGQALFTLTHDADRPFRVEAGGNTLVDIGTVFDVKLSDDRLSVAVSDGAVLFNPDRQKVRIAKGQMLAFDKANSGYELGTVPAGQVGEWREGRLTFRDEKLSDVAADLYRSTGIEFDVAPSAAAMRISGSLLLEPVRDDPRSLGPLLGVNVSRSGNTWAIRAE